jgi:2-methylisocitrate lyase-like PEP mutase family enzyme
LTRAKLGKRIGPWILQSCHESAHLPLRGEASALHAVKCVTRLRDGVPDFAVWKSKMALDLRAQKRKGETLLSLHRPGDTLVLLNVWDPIGARILEKKGYPAVATASAAQSASLGYQDGEKLRRATVIELVARVACSVAIPVTADIEMGYGKSLAELEETVEQVIECGVVGVNLEDSLKTGGGKRTLRSLEEQCQRIAKVRQVAERKGVPLVINARVDAYCCLSTKEDATEAAVARAKSYSEAGADCIYPIGPGDEPTIRCDLLTETGQMKSKLPNC